MASSYGQSSIAEKLPCMSYFLDMKRQRQGQRDYSETSVSKGSSGTSHSIGNDINQFNIGDKGEIRSDYYEFNFNIRNADAYKEQNKNDNELQPHIACGRNCGSCNVHRYECNLQSGPNIYNINLTLGNNTNYPSAITDRMPRDQEKYTQENPWQELKGQGNAMRISEELTKGMERQERYEMPTYEEPIQSGTFIEDQLTRFEDNQEYQTYHLDLDSMLDQNQTEINWNLMAAHDSSFQPSSSPTSSGYMTYSQDSGCTNSNYSSSEENDASPMPSSNYVPMANNISNYDNCRQLCQLIDMGQTDVKYHQVHKSVSEPGKIRQEGEISGELVYAELNNCRPSSQQMSPGSCMIWPQVPDNVHYYNNTPPSGTAQDVRMTHVGGLSSVHSHSNDLSNSSSESSCGYSNNNSPNDSGGSTRHYNEVHTLYADMDPENDLMSSNRTYGNGTESTSSGTGSDGISSGRDDDEIGEDENMKEDVQKTSSKHRKTDLSYIALISKAILSTPEKRMLLPEIYTYLRYMYLLHATVDKYKLMYVTIVEQ